MSRAKQAEIEAELTKLSHDYSFFMDYRRYEDLIALFLPDATFDRVLQVHHGHDDIRAGLNGRPATIITRHISTNFHFEHLSEDEVRGVVYSLSLIGSFTPKGEAPGVFAGQGILMDFHDLYRRTPDGWRFAERIGRPVLVEGNSPMLTAGRSWRFEDYAGR